MKKTLLLIPLLYAVTTNAYAITAYIDATASLAKEKPGYISLRVDTEGKKINAIEGTVQLATPEKNIFEISTAGSAFSLWPNKPSLVNNAISFVGGTTDGISGDDILVFTIGLEPVSLSSLIQIKNLTAYTADGEATAITILPKSYRLSELSTSTTAGNYSISKDVTPPEAFTLERGSDPSLFNGLYFISFNTTDTGSGINHYEVKEGSNPPVRSGTPYVLQDQTLKSKVIVAAIDNAGNVRTATLTTNAYFWEVCIVALFIIMGIIFAIRRK